MQQTQNFKPDESCEVVEVEEMEVQSQHTKRFGDLLLLICDGEANIVFAYGNSMILRHKMEELQHRNLFKLGVTQHSLQTLANFGEEGLLEISGHRSSFTLEIVKYDGERQISEEQYYQKQSNFISLVEMRCSLMKARFSTDRLAYQECQINRMSVSLEDVYGNEQVFTLVEINEVTDYFQSYTTYDDFIYTLCNLPAEKEINYEQR